MDLGKQIYAYTLLLFFSGCARPVVEEPALVVATDSVGDIEIVDANSVVEIRFVESAPKDRFIITNMGSCALEDLVIELDLSPSAGKLIFDTTATGAGVEVFQPFEVEEGNIVPLAAEGVNDGDSKLALQITSLAPGTRASFTIDVDDTLPRSDLGQIRVADSEISGAIVNITVGESEAILAKFDNGSVARANLPICPSAQDG